MFSIHAVCSVRHLIFFLGPCRMRKKMIKNDAFYLHYPYRPELENGENVR